MHGMNLALELGVVLRACSSDYVGLWQVRRIVFYQQVDGVETPDAEERQEAFNEWERLRIKELVLAGALVTTLLQQRLVELLKCEEPDGEMSGVDDEEELDEILRREDNWIKPPEAGQFGYYLTILPEGDKALHTSTLALL